MRGLHGTLRCEMTAMRRLPYSPTARTSFFRRACWKPCAPLAPVFLWNWRFRQPDRHRRNAGKSGRTLRARVHRRLSTSFRQIVLHTAWKILAIRKYACKFLPCLQKNLLENPHIFPMNTSSQKCRLQKQTLKLPVQTAQTLFIVPYSSKNSNPIFENTGAFFPFSWNFTRKKQCAVCFRQIFPEFLHRESHVLNPDGA